MESYGTTFSIKRLWTILVVGMVLMFGILLLLGQQIYQQAPPIPESVKSASGQTLFTRADIETGQNIWQSIGGMEQGSIWGHGSYLAPDWSADWLHREQRTWADDERTRRLETDAQDVQVKTVHGAKGLQYPIVLLPDLWSSIGDVDEGRELLLHDEDGRAVVDVGGREAEGRNRRFDRADAEEAEESLRLLYVAFTRARSQVIAWWARTKRTQRSALQRVIYRQRGEAFAAPDRRYPLHRPPGALSPGELAWVKQARAVRVESVQAGPLSPAAPASCSKRATRPTARPPRTAPARTPSPTGSRATRSR